MDQTEKQGISLHVACILLVGVMGQNVTGQKVTDTRLFQKKKFWKRAMHRGLNGEV